MKIGLAVIGLTLLAGFGVSPAVAEPLVIVVKTPNYRGTPPYYKPKPITTTVVDYAPGYLRTHNRKRDTLIRKAAKTAPDVLFSQGDQFYTHPVDQGDQDAGLKLMEMAAERDHAPAWPRLVQIYRRNDPVRAAFWQDRIADMGGVEDRYLAGYLNMEVRKSAVHQARGLGWYALAAQAGHLKAQQALANYYSHSDHRDSRLALAWYARAGEQGDTQAMQETARLYRDAPEVRDPARALDWYVRAGAFDQVCETPWEPPLRSQALQQCLTAYDAGRGSSRQGRLILAKALLTGDGIARDEAKAWKVLDGLSLPEAQYLSGRMLMDGTGVAADPARGRRQIVIAARRGFEEAATWLAEHPDSNDRGELDLGRVPEATYALSVSGETATDAQGLVAFAVRLGKDLFPERASDDEVEGDVLLRCYWSPQGVLDECTVFDESPRGYGFGPASLKLLEQLAVTALPRDAWLAESAGKWTEFRIKWIFG